MYYVSLLVFSYRLQLVVVPGAFAHDLCPLLSQGIRAKLGIFVPWLNKLAPAVRIDSEVVHLSGLVLGLRLLELARFRWDLPRVVKVLLRWRPEFDALG